MRNDPQHPGSKPKQQTSGRQHENEREATKRGVIALDKSGKGKKAKSRPTQHDDSGSGGLH